MFFSLLPVLAIERLVLLAAPPQFAAPAALRAGDAGADGDACRKTAAPIPIFRTEWWYATGWLATPDGKPVGFPGHLLPFRHRA